MLLLIINLAIAHRTADRTPLWMPTRAVDSLKVKGRVLATANRKDRGRLAIRWSAVVYKGVTVDWQPCPDLGRTDLLPSRRSPR